MKKQKIIKAADGVYGTKKGYSRDPDAITFGEGSDSAKERLSKSRRKFQTGASAEQIEAGRMTLEKKLEKAVIKPSGVSKAKMVAAMKKIKKANEKKAKKAIKANEEKRQKVLKAKPESTGPRTIVKKPNLGAMGRVYSSVTDKKNQTKEKMALDKEIQRKENVKKSIEANKKAASKKKSTSPKMGVMMNRRAKRTPRGDITKKMKMGGVMKNRGGSFKGVR